MVNDSFLLEDEIGVYTSYKDKQKHKTTKKTAIVSVSGRVALTDLKKSNETNV